MSEEDTALRADEANASKYTEGPWDYVPSTEHHGPYVTTDFGTTVCDFYVMSNPDSWSVRNGGDSKPIHHLYEMADANARLVAAAPGLLEALKEFVHPYQSGNLTERELREKALAAIAKAEGRTREAAKP